MNKNSSEKAEEIINLAETVKKNSSNIVISDIVTREDGYKTKADEVNKILEEICGKKGIPLIRNNNINSKRHLNRSRLHLNDTGVSVLVRNFKTFLTNFEWQIDQGIQNDNSSPSLNGAEAFLNDIKKIKQQRVKNANNTIIGHLNINSFRSKFVFAEEIIQVFDIFLVSESKLDNRFPRNLFKINGYKIFRYDGNRFGGGFFLYVSEQVPRRLLQGHPNFSNLEILVLEVYQKIENGYF